MFGRHPKRNRQEEEEHHLPDWRRLVLRMMAVITAALQHSLLDHLGLRGPNGLLRQQTLSLTKRLTTVELEQLAQIFRQAAEIREMENAEPDEWDLISMTEASDLKYPTPPPPPDMTEVPRAERKCFCNLPTVILETRKGGPELSPSVPTMPPVHGLGPEVPLLSVAGGSSAAPRTPLDQAGLPPMDPDFCPRRNISNKGTNGWVRVTRCEDCKKVLSKKKVSAPGTPCPMESETNSAVRARTEELLGTENRQSSESSARSSGRAASSNQQRRTPPEDAPEFRQFLEYQEFLKFKAMREGK